MSVREVTFYEVHCDRDGCPVKSGDLDDYSAWADRSDALEQWAQHDGWVSPDGTRTLCPEHRPMICAACDEEAVVTRWGEGYCAEHKEMGGY